MVSPTPGTHFGVVCIFEGHNPKPYLFRAKKKASPTGPPRVWAARTLRGGPMCFRIRRMRQRTPAVCPSGSLNIVTGPSRACAESYPCRFVGPPHFPATRRWCCIPSVGKLLAFAKLPFATAFRGLARGSTPCALCARPRSRGQLSKGPGARLRRVVCFVDVLFVWCLSCVFEVASVLAASLFVRLTPLRYCW